VGGDLAWNCWIAKLIEVRVWRAFVILAALLPNLTAAGERVEVCFNYGCNARVPVLFEAEQLVRLAGKFEDVSDAATERALIARAVGRMYRISGKQTPIFADRAGNLRDKGAYGRMDCIDHSTTTASFLALMQERGWLTFHQVESEPVRRSRFIFAHYSAAIERVPVEGANGDDELRRFAVDSWFVEHGEPAVVLPLDDWLKGDGPNVQ